MQQTRFPARTHTDTTADSWFQMEGPRQVGIDLTMLRELSQDFTAGFQQLSGIPPAITVFGSARPKPGEAVYEHTRAVGRALAESGFAVMTGGGPGLMEAANRGARDANGYSIGVNIKLPMEQQENPYLDLSHACDYFFPRKVLLTKYSSGFIGMPGGFGTLDELFEILTLRQTKKMPAAPVALVGSSFWRPLLEFIKDQMLANSYICKEDLESLFLTDDPQEAVRHVTQEAVKLYGLQQLTCQRDAAGTVQCAA